MTAPQPQPPRHFLLRRAQLVLAQPRHIAAIERLRLMTSVEWPGVWRIVADDLSESWTAGLGRLVTEDVLRFATIKVLVAQGVPADYLHSEWRRPGVVDAVDLVIMQDPCAAIEFKYPREPREMNAAWTQHLGELLKDFYRLAHMPPSFEERWCVQLLTPRVQKYLSGVTDRHGIQIAQQPGQMTVLQMSALEALPATATGKLTRWMNDDLTVQARCVGSYSVGGELQLLIHDVQQPESPDGLR